MLPSKEEELNKWDRICNTEGLSHYDRAQEYAKWYAEQVIKHCAEVIETTCINKNNLKQLEEGNCFDYKKHYIVVDKQSILNVINDL